MEYVVYWALPSESNKKNETPPVSTPSPYVEGTAIPFH
jgi:hypothetical protein